eukprot:gene6420-7153_t
MEMEDNVNVGLMKLNDNDRRLKPVRRTMTPLRVKMSIRGKELLEKAVRKHQAHNGLGHGPYELLYPNQIQVKNLLEKEEQEFVLQKYKEESFESHGRYPIIEVPDTIITSPANGSSCTVTNHMEDIGIHPVEMSHNAVSSLDIGPSSSNFMQSSSLPGMSNVSDRFVAGFSSSSKISVPEIIPAGTPYASFESCNDNPSPQISGHEIIESEFKSVRERFAALLERRKAKNREEERASGICPELTDTDKMLDELIELFESAAQEQSVAAKEKANKVAGDIEKGQEMRRLSMESRGESVKRKSGNEAGAGGKEKRKNYGVETFKYLNEKLKFEMEWKEREQKLKERELEEKAKEREADENERKRREENKERDFTRVVERIELQLQQQNQLLMQVIQQQQHQYNLIMNIAEQINKKD